MVKSKKALIDSTGKDSDAPFKAASLIPRGKSSPFKRNAKSSISLTNNQLNNSKRACVLKMAIVGNGRVVAFYFLNCQNPKREPFNNHFKKLVENNAPEIQDLHIFNTKMKENTPPGNGDSVLLSANGYAWSVFLAYRNEDQDIWDRDSCYERALKVCAVSAKMKGLIQTIL